VVVLVGIWLLTPWPLGRQRDWNLGRIALALAVLLSIGVAGASLLRDPHDMPGQLSTERVMLEAGASRVPPGEWHHYGRTLAGQRYSPLDQVDTTNVGQLEVAWTYRTGDVRRPSDVTETTYQVTPLKVGDLLYLCTPHNLAIAVDAATGQERWRFDPQIPEEQDRQHQTCRGVSHYADPARAGQPCGERVFLPTADARLIALDAQTGTV
jgi:quinoprotein glucose dehydrogenase